MVLKKLSYKEFEDQPDRYWEIEEFELGYVNLIVGNNASGKTRILNVINAFSKVLLSPSVTLVTGIFTSFFKKNDDEIIYVVQFGENFVLHEKLTINGEIMLERNGDGKGEIFNNDLKITHKFSIPLNQLVATRRDSIQFPYLEDLYLWSSNVRHFRFSKEEEKKTLALIESNKSISEDYNQKNTNQAIEVFRKGKGKFREKYVDRVIKDFNSIGYDIKNIDFGSLHSIKVDSPIGNKVVGLRVFENDRKGTTDQNEMSDGMFRALSLIIHYNYFELTNKNLTVLVDDIGEGLDYERSTNLIRLLIEKSHKQNIQLIMSTNDKFVMNNTNLEFWQIVSRKGGKVKMINSTNSRSEFEDFKFYGLNNFDFFVGNFFLKNEE